MRLSIRGYRLRHFYPTFLSDFVTLSSYDYLLEHYPTQQGFKYEYSKFRRYLTNTLSSALPELLSAQPAHMLALVRASRFIAKLLRKDLDLTLLHRKHAPSSWFLAFRTFTDRFESILWDPCYRFFLGFDPQSKSWRKINTRMVLASIMRSDAETRRIVRGDFIKFRWNGLEPIDDWPTSMKDYDPDFYKQIRKGFWVYLPGWEDIAWFQKMDRIYLDALFKLKPERFLKEMTPNPNHDGLSLGLNLSEDHHKNLREEYLPQVIYLCMSRNEMSHPALKGIDVSAYMDRVIKLCIDLGHMDHPALEGLSIGLKVEASGAVAKRQDTNKPMRHEIEPVRTSRPPLERVWYGKYDDGSTPLVYEACGTMVQRHGKKYITKLGLPDELPLTMTICRQRSRLSVITEFIAMDIYALLGQGAYYVPKHRLAIVSEGLHLLSRFMDKYEDIYSLEHCKRSKTDKTSLPFMKFLQKHRIPPQFAKAKEEWLPIRGLMEIFASARLLADIDVIGGIGYVIEEHHESKQAVITAVKINAGGAFSFNTASKLSNPKDIQVGRNQANNIEWDQLSTPQRETFLGALKRGLKILSKKPLIEYLIHRGGLFDQACDGVLLTEAVTQPFKKVWNRYREAQKLPTVYGLLLASIEVKPPTPTIPFQTKDLGAMTCDIEEIPFNLLSEMSDDQDLILCPVV